MATKESERFENERCSSCGLSSASTDAESLLRRAERLLWLAETIAAKAQKDDDARLCLQAVDRAKAAMDTMMRATGVIGGDAPKTDNRSVTNVFQGMPLEDLRALMAALKATKPIEAASGPHGDHSFEARQSLK